MSSVPTRTLEHLRRPHSAGPGVEVFAVDDTSVQIIWSDAGVGPMTFRIDGRRVEHHLDGGPGAIVIEELTPDARLDLTVTTPTGSQLRRRVRTLAPPAGRELFRFATINDVHLGHGHKEYGLPQVLRSVAQTDDDRHEAPRSDDLHDEPGTRDHQFDNARAAIDEALEWGAQHLVVKGDLCDQGYDWIWDQAALLLGGLSIPVSILPGNHDTGALRRMEPEVGGGERGLHVTRGVDHLDVAGLRLVLVDSTTPGNGWGRVARHADQAATAVHEAEGGVFLATHHHPQRFRVPLFWPHGIPGPDADHFAGTIAAANPNVLASSGHTHRCRRRVVGGLSWSEVAATSHFPGVWAGYVVHEGGIRQTVRRIGTPEALAWTEHTRHMFRGVWALWSTGELSDRCFTIDWI